MQKLHQPGTRTSIPHSQCSLDFLFPIFTFSQMKNFFLRIHSLTDPSIRYINLRPRVALKNILIIERFRNCLNKFNILQVKRRVQFSTRFSRFVFERRYEKNFKNTAFGVRTTPLFALTVCTLKINSLELRTPSMSQFSIFNNSTKLLDIQYRKIQVREGHRLLQSVMVETRINKVQDIKSHCNIPRLSLTTRVQFRIS